MFDRIPFTQKKLTPTPIRFNSLKKQIIVFFSSFLVLMQIAGFIAVEYTVNKSVKENLGRELVVGGRVVNRLLDQEGRDMMEVTRVTLADYALREAIVSGDKETIISAFENHAERINSAGMFKINLNGFIDTNTFNPNLDGKPFVFNDILTAAEKDGKAGGIRVFEGKVYRIVVLPVLTPIKIAWVAAAFLIDNRDAHDLQRVSLMDITFVSALAAQNKIMASTLPKNVQLELSNQLPSLMDEVAKVKTFKLVGNEYETLAIPVDAYETGTIYLVLQQSAEIGRLPFVTLEYALFVLFAMSLIATVLGGGFIAQTITRPIRILADSARKITQGDYTQLVEVQQNDEIGDLTDAFNNLSKGLAERDKVRDMLGKVTSPAIATELMNREINLGGEERLVTILFADIRNFTSLCENLAPQKSLELLNRYLQEMSEVIEEYDGVVDKYIGDGLMALFGAPISKEDDHQRAALAALEIVRRLALLDKILAAEGLPHPDVGIGLNTAVVIAGNIGSASRLNYTVLGDGVNLASRLEGLTKRYLVPIVVGEETFKQVPDMAYRELDKVRVKGKSMPVRIFELLGKKEYMSNTAIRLLAKHHEAIGLFRERNWLDAKALFEQMSEHPAYKKISSIYLEYIREFTINPPDEDWDGSFTLYEK